MGCSGLTGPRRWLAAQPGRVLATARQAAESRGWGHWERAAGGPHAQPRLGPGAAGTFPQQVDVAVCEQHVEQLQVALHVPRAHPDHLRGRDRGGSGLPSSHLLPHPGPALSHSPWSSRD